MCVNVAFDFISMDVGRLQENAIGHENSRAIECSPSIVLDVYLVGSVEW